MFKINLLVIIFIPIINNKKIKPAQYLFNKLNNANKEKYLKFTIATQQLLSQKSEITSLRQHCA